MEPNSMILCVGAQFAISPRDARLAHQLGLQQMRALPGPISQSKVTSQDSNTGDTVLISKRNEENMSQVWPDSSLALGRATMDIMSVQSQPSTWSTHQDMTAVPAPDQSDNSDGLCVLEAPFVQQNEDPTVTKDLQDLSLESCSEIVIAPPLRLLEASTVSKTQSASSQQHSHRGSDGPLNSDARDALLTSNTPSVAPSQSHGQGIRQTPHPSDLFLPGLNGSGYSTPDDYTLPQKAVRHTSDSEREDREDGDNNDAPLSDEGNVPNKVEK